MPGPAGAVWWLSSERPEVLSGNGADRLVWAAEGRKFRRLSAGRLGKQAP
ncbi:hypothetical protein SAMN05216284_102158 [Micromonospora sediminimaris]|nr:hypothetical protein SAMN05216284_102158 [Micromonospora sediminimaris]